MLGFRATKERLMQKILYSLFGSTDNVIAVTFANFDSSIVAIIIDISVVIFGGKCRIA